MKPKWWQWIKRYKTWRKKGKNSRTNSDERTELASVTTFEELVAVATKEHHSSDNNLASVEPKFWSNLYGKRYYLATIWCVLNKDIRPEKVDPNGLEAFLAFVSTKLAGVLIAVITFRHFVFEWMRFDWSLTTYIPFMCWSVVHFIPAFFGWRKDVNETRRKIVPFPLRPTISESGVVNERILAFIKGKIEEHKKAALGEQSRIMALFLKIEQGLGKITQLQARYQERAKINPTKWESKLRTLSAFEGRVKMQRESLTRQKDALLKFFAQCETTLDPLRVQLEERLDAQEIETIGREIAELEAEVPTIGFDTVHDIIVDFVRLNGALETAVSIAGQIGGVNFDLTDAVAHEPVVLDALDRLQMDLLPAPIEMT